MAQEAAAKEREEAALKVDAERAQQIVAELKSAYGSWREGAVTESGSLWRTSPSTITPGGKVQLLYNRTAGPLGALPIPEDQNLVFRFGHNGWKEPQDVVMSPATRVKGASGDDGEAPDAFSRYEDSVPCPHVLSCRGTDQSAPFPFSTIRCRLVASYY